MPTSIDRHQVQRLLAEQQAQLVEVLPAAEYEDEHLPGAINIALKELDRQTTRRLDRGRSVIVVERMRRQNLTNLPVTTSDGRLVGLLTRRDAEQALAAVNES